MNHLHRAPSERSKRLVRALGSIAVVALLSIPAKAAEDSAGVAFFESKIRPVLVESCYECHSAQARKLKGGLALDARDSMRKGGNSGPGIVPGNADESLVLLAMSAADGAPAMPPKKRLSPTVVADFRRWIRMGAPDPRDAAGTVPRMAVANARDRDWWSLKPLTRPPIPALEPAVAAWSRNPIDDFILATLVRHGLHPAPEADRRTLIRRLTFDLLGLPPTPDEVEQFVRDPSANAYDRLVDRLLASPHYGERWARHWMDVVHFAETHGHDQDRIRPNAWPYRDYLIEAFNHDRPYARFVVEQVAADAIFQDEPQLTVALGMIAAGPWDESSLRDIRDDSIDRQIGYYIDRDDMVATVMSTFVSSTVHCARCHDHKFDPFSQEDYYSLQAVFAGVDKAECGYDVDAEVARRRRALSAEIKRLGSMDPSKKTRLESELKALPPRRLVFAAASDFPPDASHVPPGEPRPVHILRRGDIQQPGKLAVAGALSALADLPGRFPETMADESARRAALARWIVDRRNPLTWRSIVNRIWHYHFGRGLVATPNDFGRMGAIPSHPALLDWLASFLLETGGSLKELHRLIVKSAAYRQCSREDTFSSAIDIDNQWLWRQHRRRLDAETVHDAILAISGQLDPRMGGPSVKQFQLSPGVHVTPVVDYTKFDWNSTEGRRRSVYRFLFRTLPDPFYDALDGADASQLTAVRNESTTPLQALVLWNDPFVLNACIKLSRRLSVAAGGLNEQITRLFALAYNRSPTSEELALLGAHADRHGLASVCRLLINSNEFLFVN